MARFAVCIPLVKLDARNCVLVRIPSTVCIVIWWCSGNKASLLRCRSSVSGNVWTAWYVRKVCLLVQRNPWSLSFGISQISCVVEDQLQQFTSMSLSNACCALDVTPDGRHLGRVGLFLQAERPHSDSAGHRPGPHCGQRARRRQDDRRGRVRRQRDASGAVRRLERDAAQRETGNLANAWARDQAREKLGGSPERASVKGKARRGQGQCTLFFMPMCAVHTLKDFLYFATLFLWDVRWDACAFVANDICFD